MSFLDDGRFSGSAFWQMPGDIPIKKMIANLKKMVKAHRIDKRKFDLMIGVGFSHEPR